MNNYLGVFYVFIASMLWGLLPIYWKLIDKVFAPEILAHRIIWSFIFLLIVLFFQKKIRQSLTGLTKKRIMGLCITSVLLGVNWLTYIWAVNNNQVVEASLGYFISPLMIVFLGVFFLKEKLNLWQVIAIIMAILGVSYSVFHFGKLPFIALILSSTFSLYSLIRKKIQISPLQGLLFETAVLVPFVLGYIILLYFRGQCSFVVDSHLIRFLLIGTGIITTMPLIFYIYGVRKVTLATTGIIQYVAPTCQLFLGVFIYEEIFTKTHLITFGFIWAGLIIYSVDSIKNH